MTDFDALIATINPDDPSSHVPVAALREAMETNDYVPSALFYQAPEAIRDELISRLETETDLRVLSRFSGYLAHMNDARATQAVIDFHSTHPEFSAPALDEGWIVENGVRRDLIFPTAKELYRDAAGVSLCSVADHCCMVCGMPFVSITAFAGTELIPDSADIKFTVCLWCVQYSAEAFCQLDTAAPITPYNYVSKNLAARLSSNSEELEYQTNSLTELTEITVSTRQVGLLRGVIPWEASTIGGYPGWIQGPGYPDCPECQKMMLFFAQIQSDLLDDWEGTLYFHLCLDCRIGGMEYQQS